MNHTKNYHLPQWSEDDLILMEDFNSAMNSLENGMTSNASAAEEAKATAENARQNAVSAFRPGYLPYAAGSYQGTGQEMTFELGFRPSFLIISGVHSVFPTGQTSLGSYNLFSAGGVLSDCVTFTDTGFVLRKVADNVYPKLLEGRRYDYIAFR